MAQTKLNFTLAHELVRKSPFVWVSTDSVNLLLCHFRRTVAASAITARIYLAHTEPCPIRGETILDMVAMHAYA